MNVKKFLNVSLCLSVLSFSFAAAVKELLVSWSTETAVIVDPVVNQVRKSCKKHCYDVTLCNAIGLLCICNS